jgi:ribosome modulation factor
MLEIVAISATAFVGGLLGGLAFIRRPKHAGDDSVTTEKLDECKDLERAFRLGVEKGKQGQSHPYVSPRYDMPYPDTPLNRRALWLGAEVGFAEWERRKPERVAARNAVIQHSMRAERV